MHVSVRELTWVSFLSPPILSLQCNVCAGTEVDNQDWSYVELVCFILTQVFENYRLRHFKKKENKNKSYARG